MGDKFSEPVGDGGVWVKQTKKGDDYLSFSLRFTYNGHQVQVNGVGFFNNKKQGNQPDYRAIVNDAYPAPPREDKSKFQQEQEEHKKNEESDLPF